MKKILLGAICALALILTSCNEDIYCDYTDVKEVCAVTDEYGNEAGYYAIIKHDDLGGTHENVINISKASYQTLSGTDAFKGKPLRWHARGSEYVVAVDHSGVKTTKLN